MSNSLAADAATEALIAQLLAEDFGESFLAHSQPIGSSWHDYEEPLSSYERQCLEASDGEEEETGWGNEPAPETGPAATPTDNVPTVSTSLPVQEEHGWNSCWIDDDGLLHESITSQSNELATPDEDHSDAGTGGGSGSPARVVSLPTYHVLPNPAAEGRNCSAPVILVTGATPPTVPTEVPSLPEQRPTRPPKEPASEPSIAASITDESPWNCNDQSNPTGKGKARAYDEYKAGYRDGLHDSLPTAEDEPTDTDTDAELVTERCEEEAQRGRQKGKLPHIRIPWPCEKDGLHARQEDVEVVEIRLGEEETLDSILEDMCLSDERRVKGKGIVC